MIDISSLRQALATLDEALAARALAPQDKLIRDACIQRFEYSYELGHKMLRRYLEETEPAGVQALSFPNLIRLGYERGLLAQSWDVWTKFRDARMKKYEAYEDKIADEIALVLPFFAAEAEFLCKQIGVRQVIPHNGIDEVKTGIC